APAGRRQRVERLRGPHGRVLDRRRGPAGPRGRRHPPGPGDPWAARPGRGRRRRGHRALRAPGRAPGPVRRLPAPRGPVLPCRVRPGAAAGARRMSGALLGLVLGTGLACLWWSLWPRETPVRPRRRPALLVRLDDDLVLAGVRGL